MRRCPLSYQMVEGRYDLTALRRLNPRLTDLHDLPYTSQDLLEESSQRATKLSIQGVQPKLSARLKVQEQSFELVDRQGTFILKPQNSRYRALPENEDLTMKLADLSGLEIPQHGLIYGGDGQLTYWIRRFDRIGRGDKLATEDFAQLLGESRETKYKASLEKVAKVVRDYCTFPQVENVRLLRLVLFNFLCGNEDQHLKNFSLITQSHVTRLSPGYDLLSTTIVLKNPEKETALPLHGKKRKLKTADFVDYYAQQILQLRPAVTESVLRDLAASLVHWPGWIARSFLPAEQQQAYLALTLQRSDRLGFVFVQLDSTEREAIDRVSLQKGSGGHQSFFKALQKQSADGTFCLTPDQGQQVRERASGSGEWQSAYRLLAAKL